MLSSTERAVDLTQVRFCLVRALDLDEVAAQTINEETRASDLPQWDSMGHLALVTELEESFALEFTDEELPLLTSVKAILNAIGKRAA
jgi:acyl carrier protein